MAVIRLGVVSGTTPLQLATAKIIARGEEEWDAAARAFFASFCVSDDPEENIFAIIVLLVQLV